MMEGIDGSEVETIREALARAKKAAQIPLVETQIRDCEKFLVRARTRFKAIDAHRAAVVGLAGGVGEDLPVDHPRPKSGTEFKQNKLQSYVVSVYCFLRWSHDSMRDTRLPHVRETCEGRVVRAQESLCWGVGVGVSQLRSAKFRDTCPAECWS